MNDTSDELTSNPLEPGRDPAISEARRASQDARLQDLERKLAEAYCRIELASKLIREVITGAEAAS